MRGRGRSRAGRGARVAAALAAAALAACGPGAEPRFRATCAPDADGEQVTCVVRNDGTAEGRACITPRVQPPQSAPIIGRRVCTGAVAPGGSVEVKAVFDQLPRARRDRTLSSRCATHGSWQCTVDVVEQSSSEMTDHVPRS